MASFKYIIRHSVYRKDAAGMFLRSKWWWIKMKKSVIYSFLVAIMIFSTIGFCGNLNILSLKYEPYPADAGQYMDLWISVRNDDTTLKINNVNCEPVFEYPFSSETNQTQLLATLGPYQDAVLQFKRIRVASDAVDGWNKLKVKCSVGSDISVTREVDVYVKSLVPRLVIGTVTTDSLEILPDTENVKLNVELQNIGKGKAQMITSKLALPEGFTPHTSYSDTYNYGTIEKDTSKTGIFYIDVDKAVKPQRYSATLRLQYKEENSNETKSMELPVELNVKPTPLFEVQKVEILLKTDGRKAVYVLDGNEVTLPSELSQGDTAELKILVKNIGVEEAKSASLRIYKQSDQPFTFDKKYDYMGDIVPNQTAEAIFEFTVDDKAELKRYLLSSEVRYVKGTDVKTDTKTVEVQVARLKSSSLMVIFILALVIMAAAALWWKYVRKK
jgi:hypothetical protein